MKNSQLAIDALWGAEHPIPLVALDTALRILFVNAAAAHRAGAPAHLIIGCSVTQFIDEPARRAQVERTLRACLTGAVNGEFREAWITAEDSHMLVVWAYRRIIRDGQTVLLLCATGATPQEEFFSNGAPSIPVLLDILAFNPSMVTVKDENSHYLYINDTARKALKIPSGPLKSFTDHDIFDVKSAERAREFDQLALTQGNTEYYGPLMLRDGQVLHAGVTKSFIQHGEYKAVVTAIHDLTELEQASSRARKAQERYQVLFQGSQLGMITLRQFEVVMANPQAATILGFADASELVGMSYVDWLHPDQRHLPGEALARARDSGQSTSWAERSYRTKDGRYLSVEVTSARIELDDGPAIFVTFQDVSERKAAQARVEQSEALNRLLVENISSGVIMQSLDGGLLHINPAAQQILGVTYRAFPAGTPLRLLAGACDESGRALPASALPFEVARTTGRPVKGFPVTWHDADHKVHWLMVSSTPLLRPGAAEPYAILSTIEDITHMHEAQEKLYHTANHDALTGLPNRRRIQEDITRAIAGARRRKEPLAVAFIDLDQFKAVNDTFGHTLGDEFIRETAQRLSEVLRDTDSIGRLGGDEFVVVLEGAGRAEAELVMSRMLEAIARPYELNSSQFVSSASIGIAVYPEAGTDTETLLQAADMAMYSAKALGRGNSQVFVPQMQAAARERVWLETNFREALEAKQFILQYQPKANAQSGQIVGVEALCRWQHPERGLIAPGEFIEFAEISGLIVELGRWVLNEACHQIKRWEDAGTPVPVAVNLSAKQLRSRSVLADIEGALSRSGANPKLLEIELTETSLVDDQDQARSIIGLMQKRGIKVYLDDFGTGYSSFSQISQFPLDALKLDRSFVSRITADERARSLACSMVAIAKSLNMIVVAEGVETSEELAVLRTMGCDVIQGFLLSRAVDAKNLDLPALRARMDEYGSRELPPLWVA